MKVGEKQNCEEEVRVAERQVAEHESRMTRENVMRFSSKAESCVICCDDAPPETAVYLGCGHGWYCAMCIIRFVESRLEEGTAGDIPCPQCSAAIPEDDLINLLPRKTV